MQKNAFSLLTKRGKMLTRAERACAHYAREKFALTLRGRCGKMLPCKDRALRRGIGALRICVNVCGAGRMLCPVCCLRECACARVVARRASARSAVRKYH